MLTNRTKWLQEEKYGDQKKNMLTKRTKWVQEKHGGNNNMVRTRRTTF